MSYIKLINVVSIVFLLVELHVNNLLTNILYTYILKKHIERKI